MEMHQVAELADRIMDALMNDPRTKNGQFDVFTNRGIVTLQGTVSKEGARQAAEEITREQEGVITVFNEIKVS